MSTATRLILVQQYIIRDVLSIILVLVSLGNLIAIMILSQRKHRTNSCSIYLLAASIFACISDNWAIAPFVYALDHFDMVNSSLVLCRIRGYIIHVNSMYFRYTLELMCVDRFALCNSRVSIRAFCRPQIAYRSIRVLICFWRVVSIHVLIWESIENNRCSVYGINGEIFGFYSLIFTGTIPISIMISCNILLMKALRQSCSRVRPLNNTRGLNRRDINLMKLVLVEVIVYILCTLAYPLMFIYMDVTNSMNLNKTLERKQIELFINFVTMSLLLYLNYNTTFYIHIFTSKTYRTDMKQLILRMLRTSREIGQIEEHGLGVRNQIRT